MPPAASAEAEAAASAEAEAAALAAAQAAASAAAQAAGSAAAAPAAAAADSAALPAGLPRVCAAQPPRPHWSRSIGSSTVHYPWLLIALSLHLARADRTTTQSLIHVDNTC